MLLCFQAAPKPTKGGGKASAKANLKRVREEWPEAYAQWGMDRAAAGQSQKGGGKRAKGTGKGTGKQRTCFHCQEEGHVAFACPKKKAGEPEVARKAKAT